MYNGSVESKEISPIYAVYIRRLGFFKRLITKHIYKIKIIGIENFEGYMDRIYLEEVFLVTLTGLTGNNNHLIRLTGDLESLNRDEFTARITRYPKNGYAVTWIHPKKLKEGE